MEHKTIATFREQFAFLFRYRTWRRKQTAFKMLWVFLFRDNG